MLNVSNPNFLFNELKEEGVAEVTALDPVDKALQERLQKGAEKAGHELILLENPGFFCTRTDISEILEKKPILYYRLSLNIELASGYSTHHLA